MRYFKIIPRYPYTIGAVFLALFETYRILQQQWAGDFWQHSAVVKALSENLIHPQNPVILSDASHAFYSPYSLLVAVFSRLTGFNAIQSLSCFAFFNLVFFLWAFWFFCRNAFRNNPQLIAAISLFLILFFVGKAPLIWSGFYHFFGLQYVLPYPSTFSMAISFLVLGMLASSGGRKTLRHILIALLSAIVIITHPNTGIFLFIATFSFHLTMIHQRLVQAVIKSLRVIVPALLLALAWPYFNFTDLLFGANADFHRDSMVLYENVLSHHWPVLFALPVLILIKKDRVAYFFSVAIAFMIILYAAGYFFSSYGFGRLISNIVIFGDLLIAYGLVQLFVYRKPRAQIITSALSICLLVYVFINEMHYKRSLSLSHKDISYYTRFHFLETAINKNDVVLADKSTNLYVPTFNGKVFASFYPLYWVDDIQQRRHDLLLFFSPNIADSTRKRIVGQYKADYILIDRRYVKPDSSFVKWLNKSGRNVYDENKLELIKLHE